MKLVLWGDWLPDHVESLVQEFRNRSCRPRLTVQLDPLAKSVDFCNVQADEFVRSEATDIDALRSCLLAQGSSRLALNLWFLMARDKAVPFLEGMDRAAALTESTVCWMPRPWSASGTSVLFAEKNTSLSLLLERSRMAFETVWNGGRTMGAVLSGPSRGMLETLTGRRGLGPLMRLGLPIWPSEMQNQEAKFVDRQHVARALVNGLDAEGSACSWMTEVAGDDVHSVDEKPRSTTWLPGCSWESYCQAPLLGHFSERKGQVGLAQMAHWCYQIAVVEANSLGLQQQRETAGRAIFPR